MRTRSRTLDAILIERCQKADTHAFDEVVARYKGSVFNYLYRMTESLEDAEDLTQEVFVRMVTNFGSFRAEASLLAWLFRIATNLRVDAFRRRRGWVLVESLDAPRAESEGDKDKWPQEVADWSKEPLEELTRRELIAQIQAALDRLPPKLRSALVLCDIEGMTYAEIAAAEGVPLGTVKSRIFHARAQVCERLRPYIEI